MKRTKETIVGRRNILKKVTIAAGTVTLFKGLIGKTHALASDSHRNSDLEDNQFIPTPKQVKMNEGVLPLPGGAGLYYRDTGGNGPALVLCHPGRGSALSWPYQQPAFAAAGYRTIVYSRRGRFGSPAGSTENTGSYAGDLDALMTHLNVDKFHILGLAAGGFTVTDYIVSYPGKVLSVTIACSLFGLWDKDIDSRSDFILSKGFGELPPEFKEIGPAYRWAHPEGVLEWKKMEEESRGGGVNVRQRAMSKVTWDKIRALNIPTFLLTGGADLYQPPSMMRAAARELPGCETLVVSEAGHAVQWEQPELFNNAVIDFLNRHS